MGLDMYLTRKIFVGGKYGHRQAEGELEFSVNGREYDLPIKQVSEIVMDAGYWRKANAIHAWFVEHVQDGEDDCREYYVSREMLQELRNVCQQVLDSCEMVDGQLHTSTSWKNGEKIENYEDGKVVKDSTLAEQLLPTTSGFFFGGTDYDEWYVRDLEHTIKICDEALATEEGDFNYQSSW